jgi:Mrp family chromosome partitioning ATPase
LRELLQTYMKKHAEVHFGGSKAEGYWFGQRDEWRGKLKQTEEELKQLKAEANLPFPEDARRFFESQNMKIQEELATTRVDLAQRQAMLGSFGSYASTAAGTNAAVQAVPSEKLGDYGDILTELAEVRRLEHDLLRRRQLTSQHPDVQNARRRLADLAQQKSQLESEYPSLTQFAVGMAPGSTNATDVAAELAAIRGLVAKVAALELSLTNIQTEASRMMVFEPRIKELQRRQAEEQKNYDRAMANIDITQQGASQAASQAINMSEVQSPTPPGLDYKKMIKLVGMVLAGCIGMGLGLAFAIDHVVDHSLKRTHDIEKHLRMPVFLTIPDTSWAGRLQPKWFRRRRTATGNGARGTTPSRESAGTALAAWKPVNHLQNYAEGLGERVMTYFEVNNMNLKKPKLVAVTGCGKGTGVSTLATGLAASLSKTGEGNVLLVDMNVDEGVAHPYHKGKPGCGISDALEPENRAEAQVGEKLFLASITGQEARQDIAEPLPMRFNHLMPKLKASDYDYIIFDMPPVSPTNATPRMASHMDIVLLILESEKTGRHAAARATNLMRESRANVAAVLNKYREHLPAAMARE